MNIILSIDIGTSHIGVVALEVDADEIIYARCVANTATLAGLAPNHHEQDAREIFGTVKNLLSQSAAYLCERFSCNACFKGVVVTGQMHGILFVDSQNEPTSHLITWRDQRAADSPKVHDIATDRSTANRCGCRLQPGYGFATLYELLSHDPQFAAKLFRGDLRVCSVTDYVAASLSGCLVTDPSMAASWGGLDIRSHEWDGGVLNALQIPESALPLIRASADPIGRISASLADELGIDTSTMICAGIGDHQASILGCRPIGIGSCVLNVGTGGQVSIVTDQPENSQDLETRPLVDGYFVVTGTSLCGGWSYQYLADLFRAVIYECTNEDISRDSIYEVMNRIGKSAPKDADRLVVDPVFLGSRHSPQTAGSVVGIDETNLTASNLVRATANGIIDELFSYYQLMQQRARRVHAAGNAIRHNPLLIQAIKERWGIDPIVASRSEASAYGAASLAAVRLGLVDSSWLIR